MLVTPLVLIQIFSKRMLIDWPKCGSDPQDEGHLACRMKCSTTSLIGKRLFVLPVHLKAEE